MVKHELDEVDRHIIDLLKVDGRMPNAAIAREVGMSEGAVRRRLKLLTESGAVRVVGVSPAAIHGLTLPIIVGMRISIAQIESIVAALSDIEQVAFVYETSGRFNLIAQGFFADQRALRYFLHDQLAHIEGISVVETLTILTTRKSGFGMTSPRV